MTAMLASVSSVAEMQLVQEAGVDIIDLKNPQKGALGALENNTIKKIVARIDGLIPISATIGDLPYEAGILEPAIREMALTGVDIVKVGVFGKITASSELKMLSELASQGIRIVLVIFAEQYDEHYDLISLSETGISGVMLDTMDKHSGSLRDKLSASLLQQFVSTAKSRGLLTGLAGSLNEKDIAPLLQMKPDYLGFRGGLCRQGKRENRLDRETIIRVRQYIPGTRTKILQTAALI